MTESSFEGYKVVRSYLIVNFVLLVILLFFAYLAIESEKINTSLLYSPEQIDRWCATDVWCDQSSVGQYPVNATFSLVSKFDSNIVDQTFTMPTFEDSTGIVNTVFDIYLTEEPSPGTVNYPSGVCAGWNNYSDYGVSIYLKYFWNSTSWTSDNINSSILNIFSKGYRGSSAYTNSHGDLTNNGNTLTLKLNSLPRLTDHTITTSASGISSLFKGNLVAIPLQSASTLYSSSDAPSIHMNNLYTRTLQTVEKAKTSSGSCYIRCIDPSYTTPVHCSDVFWNNSRKLYYYSADGNGDPCTLDQLNRKGKNSITTTMQQSGCGVPYCHHADNINSSTAYQTNDFKLGNTIKQGNDNADDYTIDGKTFIGAGDGDKYGDLSSFNNAAQAQHLLFCAGTDLGSNNLANTPYNTTGKYPAGNVPSNYTQLANKPNAQIDGTKYILGFK